MYVEDRFSIYESLTANQNIVIALVEYLTSEEAGQPLGSRFAWPVGHLIASCGKSSSSKINQKHAGINTNKAFEKVKGSSSVKHASGSNNVAGLFGVKDLKTA
jgi:dihydroceramidase